MPSARQPWLFWLLASLTLAGEPTLRRFADPAQKISPVAMAEDHAGFLWIAADEGLFRFDGSHFHKIPGEFKTPSAVTVLGPAVLLGAGNGLFSYAGGVVRRVSDDQVTGLEKLAGDLALVRFANPNSQRGMVAVHWQGGRAVAVAQPGLTGWAWLSRDDSLWMKCGEQPCYVVNSPALRQAAREGLLAASFARAVRLPWSPPGEAATGGLLQGFLRVAPDRYLAREFFSGAVLMPLPGARAHRFHVGNFTRANGHPGMYMDHAGRVWIPGDFLWVYEGGAMKRTDFASLQGAPVISVFEDARHRLWLGLSGGRGLAVSGMAPEVENWPLPPSYGEVDSITRSADSTLLAATKRAGLLRLRAGAQGWEAVGQRAGLPGIGHVVARGTITAGLLHLGGPAALSPAGAILPPVPVDDSGDESSFRRVEIGPDGTWIATAHNRVVKYRAGKRVAVIKGKHIWNLQDIAFDGAGTAWVASDEGVCRLEQAACRPMLAGKGARSLAFGKDGALWVAYRERGLSRFSQPDRVGKATHLLPQTSTMLVRTDGRGWVWRLTDDDGVWVCDGIHTEDADWIHLGEREGLLSAEAGRYAFFEDRDGSVWLGTARGISHLRPTPAWFNPPADNLRLTAVSVEGQEYAERTRFPVVFSSTGPFRFSLGGESLLPWRYRLRPRDPAWRPSERGEPFFAELEPGRYEFEARRGPAEGGETARYVFEVKRPWGVTLRHAAMAGLPLALLASAGGTLFWRRRRRASLPDLPDLSDARLALLETEAEHLTGRLLDERFELEAAVAQGGFGTVFSARDRRDGSRCAVKVFRAAFEQTPGAAFGRELEALEKLSHPNVVRTLGHGVLDDGAPFLAMEFIEGATLRAFLQDGALAPGTCASWLRQIGAALTEMHARHIFHSDIKPENLMIRRNAAPGEEVVVIDFSLAIIKDPQKPVMGLSRPGGTLQYLAPEQVLGCATPESDIYSFGKVIFEMVTGESVSAVFPQVAVDLPQRVRAWLKESSRLTPEAAERLAAALEFDPSKRPCRADELANAIAAGLQRLN